MQKYSIISKFSKLFVSYASASSLLTANKDEEASDRSSRGKLGAAQVRSQWKSSTRHHLAKGRQTPDRARGGRGPSEEMDAEPQEPDATAQWQIHMQGVQSGGGDQRHIQSWSHTWVSHSLPTDVLQLSWTSFECLLLFVWVILGV